MDTDAQRGAPDEWRTAGERIDALIDGLSTGGALARERAEQLVREVADLYGEALARILASAGPQHRAHMVDDDLIASLLLVHGLHPDDVETRVRNALDGVRPYLGSHGGDVELIGVQDGVVTLRLLGSCKSCPSSSVTLELAVTDAVQAAAPETTSIEVRTTDPAAVNGAAVNGAPLDSGSSGALASGSLFSTESLMAKVHAHSAAEGTWSAVPELADGELGGFSVAGTALVIARIGEHRYAYLDRCPRCEGSFAGAAMARRAGRPVGDAVLRCPTCRAHYDVRGAGAGLDDPGLHLDPLPVLVKDGVLSIAIPAPPVGAPS
ncbi:NifU family protein [Rhodococcus sp. G-MC3]|uniref:NifU family protein n=1 Tax=Rhodococcus sp. G-MC3 TaxID=3046209 RepID=UPI0024BA7CF9|nr:NifU family protein [Rhodococcus sp. G-MC3]MDJ0394700.1 NifU family protein [Rhodococcus sp. G-MC3]